jgi:hypothetical protein
MSEEDSGAEVASSFFWALALIVIVMIIAGAVFYSGVLSRKQKTEIDVNVTVPSR